MAGSRRIELRPQVFQTYVQTTYTRNRFGVWPGARTQNFMIKSHVRYLLRQPDKIKL